MIKAGSLCYGGTKTNGEADNNTPNCDSVKNMIDANQNIMQTQSATAAATAKQIATCQQVVNSLTQTVQNWQMYITAAIQQLTSPSSLCPSPAIVIPN